MTRLPGDPGAGGKVLFAIGGRLPERNREWVRHELTDAGWRTRLIVRHLVIMLPLCAALALLPGAAWIRIAVPALFLISSVGIVAMYADDIRVSRLRRHGLEPPDDPDLGRPSHLTAWAGAEGRLGWTGAGGLEGVLGRAGGRGGRVGAGRRGTVRSVIGFRGCRR